MVMAVRHDVVMLRHVVMFTWTEGIDDAHIAATSNALDALPATIDTIRSYEHGPDLGLSNTNADYVVVAEFDDADALTFYRDHPAHVAFAGEFIAGRTATRLAVQYEVGRG